MLEKYLDKISEQRLAHPLSPEAYHEWRDHPVTVRLLEDLEIALIVNATDLSAESNVSFFAGAKDVIEDVVNWKPEELDDEEES